MFDEHNFVKLGKNGAKKLQKSLWFEYCKKGYVQEWRW